MSKDILSMYVKDAKLQHLSKDTRVFLSLIFQDLYTEATANSTLNVFEALKRIACMAESIDQGTLDSNEPLAERLTQYAFDMKWSKGLQESVSPEYLTEQRATMKEHIQKIIRGEA